MTDKFDPTVFSDGVAREVDLLEFNETIRSGSIRWISIPPAGDTSALTENPDIQAFLDKHLANSASNLFVKYRPGIYWKPAEIFIGSPIQDFFTGRDDSLPNFAEELIIEYRDFGEWKDGYRTSFRLGEGYDRARKELGWSGPQRFEIDPKASVKRARSLLNGLVGTYAGLFIGEDVFNILERLYGLPESQIHPLEAYHRGVHMGPMWLYDPPIRNDFVDFERSFQRWNRWTSEERGEWWACSAIGAGFHRDYEIGICRTALGIPTNLWISRDLLFSMRNKSIPGFEPGSNYQEKLGIAPEPRLLF